MYLVVVLWKLHASMLTLRGTEDPEERQSRQLVGGRGALMLRRSSRGLPRGLRRYQ